MSRPRSLSLAALLVMLGGTAHAESFLLKSGGLIEGELLNPRRASSDPYEVKTDDGIRLSLAKELVAKVTVKKDIEREYERLVPDVANTAEAHWEMAQWCKEQGLRPQRELHLREVIARDPDHEKAHLALGHQRFEGKWQRPDEYMASQGFVKHDGLWRTRQDVELARLQEEAERHVIEWRQKIRIWRSWIGKKREAEGLANFRAIRDPLAAPPLIDLLEQKGQPRELRLVLIDVLGEIPGNPAETTFIKLGMADADESVRDACVDSLVRTNSKAAVHNYLGLLKNEKSMPDVINRAAAILARLKDPIATPILIDSLNTIHEVLVTPGQNTSGLGPISSSFGSDPLNPNSGAFSAGAAKPVKQKVPAQNDAVLKALQTLHPGMNFGFSEAAWRQWYLEKYQPPKVDLRRGQ